MRAVVCFIEKVDMKLFELSCAVFPRKTSDDHVYREISYTSKPHVNACNQELSKSMDDEGLSLAVSHNGRYIASGGSAAIVKLWGYDAADLIFAGKGHSGAITGLRYIRCRERSGECPDSNVPYAGPGRNYGTQYACCIVYLVKAGRGTSRAARPNASYPDPPRVVVSPDFSFSPDDKQLTSVGEDGNIFIWNVFG